MNSINEAVTTPVEIVLYQVFHIIFRDSYNSDHHCQVVAKDKTEALNKVDYDDNRRRSFLSKKNAERSTIVVMNEEEFENAYRSALRPFYIVFQNGTRRFCCILATDPLEAENEFKDRFATIHGYTVMEKADFNRLLIGGKWKEIPLRINLS